MTQLELRIQKNMSPELGPSKLASRPDQLGDVDLSLCNLEFKPREGIKRTMTANIRRDNLIRNEAIGSILNDMVQSS